ncbi:MAG TPA: chorismate synthase [Chloroflexota bacterium]|nr:chorismate synthase [Chloroflexota bacterium]
MLRFLTAGESHGPQLTAIIDGVPAGLALTSELLDADMRRRQLGHGRSERQKMERDHAEIVGGVRGGLTLGSPIALVVANRVWDHWQDRMHVEPGDTGEKVTALRPGHADLAGVLKYGHDDVRNVLERASARETAARVAVGAVARALLAQLDITIHSHTLAIGSVVAPELPAELSTAAATSDRAALRRFWEQVEESPVRCADAAAGAAMVEAIDEAKREGYTLGGICEIAAYGLPAGLGSHVQWDRKLDGQIAAALMSIQSVKGVAIGPAFENALLPGTEVHDVVQYQDGAWRRTTNRAGGLEGGITNGEPLLARIAVKPISTMRRALPSADLLTGEQVPAHYERSDTAVVPAAGVIAEAMLAFVLANALLEKCGGDSMDEVRRNLDGFVQEQRCRMPATLSGRDV